MAKILQALAAICAVSYGTYIGVNVADTYQSTPSYARDSIPAMVVSEIKSPFTSDTDRGSIQTESEAMTGGERTFREAVPTPTASPPEPESGAVSDVPARDGGSSLEADFDRMMVSRYASIDRKIQQPLSKMLGKGIYYPDFSATVRAACGVLDREIDFNRDDMGFLDLDTHTIEGQVAEWVFVHTGMRWDGYCNWHRANPKPTPPPTPTPVPDAPLTVCWADQDRCGVEALGLPVLFRVKVLQDGQAGWLEMYYPHHPPDGPASLVCNHPGINGFRLPASDEPVYQTFETCEEGLVEFRWLPDVGDEYTYQLTVANLGN